MAHTDTHAHKHIRTHHFVGDNAVSIKRWLIVPSPSWSHNPSENTRHSCNVSLTYWAVLCVPKKS